ncbi:hypothetical protein BDN72DRAFT_834771 [Pluteus cervinus]|uniref:Uncharacterized protein n=1 Tax=Pluteus cervinus TaxID=181527 RepID=A0ACD3B6U9_9AGAR|nr:hypothetical protein BDN72DRAFT_834771 [Pluteus cervinus]
MTTLYVAHFGHPLLKGAKHWSFLLPISTQPGCFTAWQITGSTFTYEIKPAETVSLNSNFSSFSSSLNASTVTGLQNFMGMVPVGTIDENQRAEFEKVVLTQVPVLRGSVDWNCQNWIVDALAKAKESGFDVSAYSLTELQGILEKVVA